jgi:hypothetical protein
VEDVVVEVVLLAELEGGLDLVLGAEQDGAVRMRVDRPAEAVEAPVVAVRVLQLVEGEDDDVRQALLEVGCRALGLERQLGFAKSSFSSRTICWPSSTLSVLTRMRGPAAAVVVMTGLGGRGTPPSVRATRGPPPAASPGR